MSAQIAPRSGAEQIRHNADLTRQQELTRSNVRLSRSRRRAAVVDPEPDPCQEEVSR